MEIKRAKRTDLTKIEKIYHAARIYMTEQGNPNQWEPGYPSREILLADIDSRTCYLLEKDGVLQGVFVFVVGEEPTYQEIEHGQWSNDQTYGTIHRIASAGKSRGVAKACFDFCAKQIAYLRIDTHPDNQPMQAVILGYGFRYCGIIRVRNGKRMAFDYSTEKTSTIVKDRSEQKQVYNEKPLIGKQ